MRRLWSQRWLEAELPCLGKFCGLSGPHISHLENGYSNRASSTGLLQGEVCLAQSLAHARDLVNATSLSARHVPEDQEAIPKCSVFDARSIYWTPTVCKSLC